ncbi:unnamed protein product [Ostreobium quekettii]|uniref:Radial spoke protein 3 n=1 Tax=Ostreobium quekettii TaxID=121088 RepID=A0A8S1IS40_9CHLO|nr:unnamed protein product [Ostreobium quekettii]
MDATTQIEPGDLFDFNFEVEPILEVLVGKTLEQGYMEVLEEEELAEMRAHQEHFEQIRNAELVATQRMEAAEIRKMEEKERRLAQERERLERERVVREKVAASTFARGYLNGIVTTVFDRLERKGFFYDPVEREVENVFMPWLKDETLKKIRNDILMRQLVVSLVKEAKDLREAQIREAQEKEERQRKALEEHAAREAAAMAKLQEDIREGIERKASLILRELPEPVAPPEVVDGVRSELQAKAEEACTAAWEEAKAKVLEEAKAEFRSGKEEEEIDEAEEEAFVAAAVEAVPKPEAQGITDRDVLSAMLESGAVSKDGIVHGLAIYYLAEAEGKLVPQDPTEEEDKKE